MYSVVTFAFVLLVTILTISSFGVEVRESLYSIIFDVYEKRGLNKTKNLPTGFSYFLIWTTNVILPFLLIKSLENRSSLNVAFCFISFVAIFLSTSAKSQLYSSILVLAVYFTWNLQQRWSSVLVIIFGFTLLSTIIFLIDINHDDLPVLTLVTVRRIAAAPGVLSAFYFEFFLNYPKLWFSDSFLKGVFQNPILYDIETTIGGTYFGNFSTNANANFLANAYAQGGYLMMVFLTGIYGLVMSALDKITRPEDKRSVAGIMLVLAMTLSNTSLQTTFISGGLAFLVVFIFAHKTKPHLSRFQIRQPL